MPDLNLIEDEGAESLPEGAEHVTSTSPSSGGGGGGMRMVIILVLLVAILAGVVYILNSRGIIHLWGKKQQTVVTVPEDQFPTEQYAEQAPPSVDTTIAADTSNVALLETTPIEEAASMPAEPVRKKDTKLVTSMTGSKLAEMKGDFTVQVVAFKEKTKADDVLANLEIAGYPAFVEKVPMKGGDWFTVRIGRYGSRDEAKEAVKSFAEQIRSNYVIDKVRAR